LLRYMQTAGVEILEVTAPDKLDRRRRGKNDDFDAESAAHAAFARRHTTPCWSSRPWQRNSNHMASGKSGAVQNSDWPWPPRALRACSEKLRAPLSRLPPLIPSFGATARSSSPRPCGNGSKPWARRPRSSSRAAHRRTATARASTRSCETNCSTVRSSTASPRQRSSSRHGGTTTIPSGLAHRSATSRRHRRPSSGQDNHPDRLHRRHRRWPKSHHALRLKLDHPMGSGHS
jgi:hypothetical protein